MKKPLLTFAIVATCLAGFAQTNTPPPATPPPPPSTWGIDISGIKDLLGHSNVLAAPYLVYSDKGHRFGGGIGLGYRLNPNLVPYYRIERIGRDGISMSGSMQLEAPIKLFGGKLVVVPLGWAGVGINMNTTANNDNAIGIAGTGLSIHLPPSSSPFVPMSILAGYERWTGNKVDENHILAGLCWAF